MEDAETAVTTSDLGLILLVGAGVVLAAVVAARVAHGIGLPGLLGFLGLGAFPPEPKPAQIHKVMPNDRFIRGG